MTSTPKSIGDESLSESWVDMSLSSGRVTPVAVPVVGLLNGSPTSPPSQNGPISHIGEEYLRLLKEAQRESNHSSARVSLASSRRESRCESPKSPPNSPNNELSNEEDELKGIFINKESGNSKDWILRRWTAQIDPNAPNKKHVSRNKFGGASVKNSKFEEKSAFSKEIVYTFLFSNFISLIIGAGIGLWLSKRSALTNFPMN